MPRPGSLLWLLRHELRLTWRGYLSAWARGTSPRGMRRRLVVMAVALHVIAFPVALAVRLMPLGDSPALTLSCTGALLLVWSLMLSQTLFGATQALYIRGDLDLLLSSPLSARKMLTVRALAIVVNAIGAWALLALPFVDMLVLLGAWRWVTVYPLLVCLGLSATAFGLGLAMLLFALAGPARTKSLAQVLAALIGVTAFMISQIQAFLSPARQAAVQAWSRSFASPQNFDPQNPIWLPAQALLGDGRALILTFLAAVLVFTVVVAVFGQTFAAHARAIAGLKTREPSARRRRTPATLRFHGGIRTALLRKEWRLLRRDPWLISQILMQILYLLPLCFIYWRQTQGALGGLGMMAVVIAGHLAGGLIWITIASEDSPDLLISAPVAPQAVIRAKLIAALTPVGAILFLPLVAIGAQSVPAFAIALAGCAASAGSATLLGLWYQKPAKRKDFMMRRKGSTLVNLVELLLNFLWGLATAFAMSGSIVALVFIAVALGVIAGLRLIAPPSPILSRA